MASRSLFDVLEASTSRRRFLRDGGVALAAGVSMACGSSSGASRDASSSAGSVGLAQAGGGGGRGGGGGGPNGSQATAAAGDTASVLARANAMDAMHEKGIRAFPARTAGLGNQRMAPRLDGGAKVFELTATRMQWETEPGRLVEAWAYNDQVPGPQIRVHEGDRVRMILHNELPESTSIHFHGVELPNAMDGVPFITQPPVKPGQSFTYEFTVPNAGSHMYHSHHNSAKQVGLGLLGAFVVEPRQPGEHDRVDVDEVLILNDGAHGYTLNGKSFPATQPIVARLGQRVRIRFMNEGMMIHPMHLHGMHMTLIAKDGWPLPAPWRCDTLNVAPGERWDAIVACTNPGTWAFHCHILPHAESEHGMFGMVTALVVNR